LHLLFALIGRSFPCGGSESHDDGTAQLVARDERELDYRSDSKELFPRVAADDLLNCLFTSIDCLQNGNLLASVRVLRPKIVRKSCWTPCFLARQDKGRLLSHDADQRSAELMRGWCCNTKGCSWRYTPVRGFIRSMAYRVYSALNSSEFLREA
jgi:hypothetical protein